MPRFCGVSCVPVVCRAPARPAVFLRAPSRPCNLQRSRVVHRARVVRRRAPTRSAMRLRSAALARGQPRCCDA
eukprot:3061012-Pyramimonas_sp.AAC.1